MEAVKKQKENDEAWQLFLGTGGQEDINLATLGHRKIFRVFLIKRKLGGESQEADDL